MARFRKKPVEVDAVLYDGHNVDAVFEWAEMMNPDTPCMYGRVSKDHSEDIIIATLEGDMVVRPGSWIIHGVAGEFYPCQPDIFAATYEQVDA